MVNVNELVELTKEAGKYMLRSSETASTLKSNAKDFVTISDIKSQEILRNRLSKIHPRLQVLSEEDSEEERAKMYQPDFTGFVLDPIDGTYSFKRDMRESVISVGYIERGQPYCGVIYDPYREEIFTVQKGRGASRNGQGIRVSEQSNLEGASVAISNSYDDEAMSRNLRRHLAIYEQTQIMPWTSCPGSGVQILASVACGRVDAYHHNGLRPWDSAVGFLLIEEAGGKVVTLAGQDATFTDGAILVGNIKIVDKLAEVFGNLSSELLR